LSDHVKTEILLDRGLTFRVTRDRGLVDGVRHVDVEVVSRGGTSAPAGDAAPGNLVVGRDITNSVDFDTLPAVYNPATGSDDALRAILEHQGFDARPAVVSAADFDAAVARGEVRETWRGLKSILGGTKSPAQIAEEYRTGDLDHVGLGINGDGIYVAVRKEDAQYYGSELVRIGLRNDARIVHVDDLHREMDDYFADLAENIRVRNLDNQLMADLARTKSPRARAGIRKKYRSAIYGQDRSRKLAIQRDPGRFAALRGYDAIEIPRSHSIDKHHEFIVLNRAATIVQEAS
jgi:hypothetical protein